MTLFNFNEVLKDVYSGVTGLHRKKSKYRCLKRGACWDSYVESIKKVQREFGEKELGLITSQIIGENSLLKIVSTFKDSFSGAYLPIPKGPYFIRKRAHHRFNKKKSTLLL